MIVGEYIVSAAVIAEAVSGFEDAVSGVCERVGTVADPIAASRSRATFDLVSRKKFVSLKIMLGLLFGGDLFGCLSKPAFAVLVVYDCFRIFGLTEIGP